MPTGIRKGEVLPPGYIVSFMNTTSGEQCLLVLYEQSTARLPIQFGQSYMLHETRNLHMPLNYSLHSLSLRETLLLQSCRNLMW